MAAEKGGFHPLSSLIDMPVAWRGVLPSFHLTYFFSSSLSFSLGGTVNWSEKAKRRKTTGTGRTAHLKVGGAILSVPGAGEGKLLDRDGWDSPEIPRVGGCGTLSAVTATLCLVRPVGVAALWRPFLLWRVGGLNHGAPRVWDCFFYLP
jgi:hypothetical protein